MFASRARGAVGRAWLSLASKAPPTATNNAKTAAPLSSATTGADRHLSTAPGGVGGGHRSFSSAAAAAEEPALPPNVTLAGK